MYVALTSEIPKTAPNAYQGENNKKKFRCIFQEEQVSFGGWEISKKHQK
jgi:hypothetical protein